MTTGAQGPARADPSWVLRLAPQDPSSVPDPAAAPDTTRDGPDGLGLDLDGAVAALGPGPVGWGLELAGSMVEAMLAAVPELAVPDVARELRRGSVAVVLGCLGELHARGTLARLEVPEVLLGPAELVSRGIGVEHMLRSVHTAHAVGVRAMMDACARHLPAALRFEESRRVAEVLLELTDVLLQAMTKEFAEAQAAWSATSSAVRRELVHELLAPDGPEVTAGDARTVLGYDLDAHHLAVVVWADVSADLGAPQLEAGARALLRRAGATGTLVVPVGRRRVWAWGSRTGGWAGAAPDVADFDVPAGACCAVGVVGRGHEGFRTSHQQALEAVRVAELAVPGPRVFRYADLELVCMATGDLAAARAMVQRELGGLAAPDDTATELRETLGLYLAHERSLNRSSEALHVARSTVAYRVRRAEELRGAPIGTRRPQLQVALLLAEVLGPRVLG